MFSTSQPSKISFSMPSWTGGIQQVGGAAWDQATYFGRKALDAIAEPLKPVSRAADQSFELARDTADGLKSAATGFSSGAKWAGFLIVAGIAIYALAVLSPFIPKPQGGK